MITQKFSGKFINECNYCNKNFDTLEEAKKHLKVDNKIIRSADDKIAEFDKNVADLDRKNNDKA